MRQTGMRTAWTLMCALAFWSSAAPARAAEEAVGEHLLPQEVLVFFSVPSVPDLKERLNGSLLGEMLKDPEMQPFLEGVQAKLEEASAQMKDESGLSLEELLEIPQGEITFAVVELPPRKLALVMLLDYGDNHATIESLLDKMDEGLKEQGGEAESEDENGVSVTTYSFPSDGQNPFNKLAYFDHDSYLGFSSDPDALRAVLDRWNGESDETFAQQDVFKYIMEKCSTGDREPLVKFYINPIGLTQSIVGMMQAQLPQAGLVLGFLPILGLDKFKGIGTTYDIDVEDFDSLNKSFFYVDQPATGVMNIFQFPAADLSPPKWVPADSAMYMAMNWNVAGAYTAIENLVDSFQGPGAFGRLVDQAADQDGGPGIHMKKDLIDQLTGQIHVVMGPTEDLENPAPKVLFALDVKNAAKMSAVLAKAAKADDFSGTTRDFEGVTIYEIEGAPGNSASIAIADKHLLISTDAALLEGALRPSGNSDPLSSDPVYQKLAKSFPKKASVIAFQNGNSQMQSLYQMLKAGNLPDMPEEVQDLVEKLPEFDVLKKYLRASAGYYVPDKKGALATGFTLKEEK